MEKNFEDLISMGCMTRVVRLATHDVLLKTINSEVQSSVMSRLPVDGPEASKMDKLQTLILANAIDSIDGIKMTEEEKVALLSKMQSPLLSILFSEYDALLEGQNKVFEDVKKNILQPKKTP